MNLRTPYPVGCYLYFDSRCGHYRAFYIARRTISRYCTTYDPSEYDLFRGECGNLAEECCRPVGRGDKRRRGYDIYDFVGL